MSEPDAMYGPQWYQIDPLLAVLGIVALVALLFCSFVVVTNWADKHKAREERRTQAQTAYQDALRRMRQGVIDDDCSHKLLPTIVNTVEAWKRLRQEDPEHCPAEPEILDLALEEVEPAGRLPS